MKRIYLLLFGLSCLLLTGCMKKHIDWQFHVNSTTIPSCYETNRNIFGEFTGQAFLCGDLVFYSQYAYERDNYTHKRTDGLYVRTLDDSFTVKLADGIIHSIVVREDGVYYLKLHEKGKIFLYNLDLYRYNFESRRNELLVEDCSFVQFSDDSVYYCPHYLSDKSSYVKYGAPLNLKNEGRIVKHSLLTGEEQVVAQVDGNIYRFLVAEDKIAFSGGEGHVNSGGENLYLCNLDGSQLTHLRSYPGACIFPIYLDTSANTVIYDIGYFENRSWQYLDISSGEVLWTVSQESLDKYNVSALPSYYHNRLYFIANHSENGDPDQILCYDPYDPQSSCFISFPGYCMSLPQFYQELYGCSSEFRFFPIGQKGTQP